jgi:hypothetical protein
MEKVLQKPLPGILFALDIAVFPCETSCLLEGIISSSVEED